MGNVLEITPLTRVEGHGSVRIFLDGSRVESVQLCLGESPRLFEALLKGKNYAELPEIICRVCSICSTVHRVTSLQALEKAFEVPVTTRTRLYRELIVLGGLIESHALHLFCLTLPDYYNTSGFAELATRDPQALQMGLRLKAAGNLIQETVGGRLIHPVNLVPGGMGKLVNSTKLRLIKETLTDALPDAMATYRFFSANPGPLNESNLPTPIFLAVRSCPEETQAGECLEISGGHSIPIDSYQELLEERVVPYSHAKQSLAQDKGVTTGALARLNLGQYLSPQSAQAFFDSRKQLIGADIRANTLAQAVELLHAVERALEIIELLLSDNSPQEQTAHVVPRRGNGCAAMEAPRGTLIHSYSFNNQGICTAADIITPTAINQAPLERDLLALARELEGVGDAVLKHRLEVLVRAYDPCISCAVHLVRR